MSKYIYCHLTGITLLAILLVWGLYWHAELPYKIKNGFDRYFVEIPGHSIVRRIPVAPKAMSFDGVHNYYFYTTMLREKVWRMNLTDLRIDSLEINWPEPKKLPSNFKLMAADGSLYLHDQNEQLIFSYELHEKRFWSHHLIKMPNQQVLTGMGNLVMRCSDFITAQPVLLKQGLVAGGMQTMIRPWPDERRGLIPTDGEIHFDPVTKLLSYHYFYKNGFMVWDLNLDKVSSGKTIDTVFKGNLKVKRFADVFTIEGAPRFVNGIGCSDRGKLYINSHLKADNEAVKAYRNNTVIDVYDLWKGVYLYSFYVPVFKERKLNGFEVRAGNLICLYGEYVVIYKMKAVA